MIQLASRNIKGITVEIGGDTTKLDKAISGSEKIMKDAQKELKEIDKSIQKNPENIELWKQKQEALNKAFEAGREKLKTLTDAQQQMNDKFKNGEISAEQYRAFQRELENTRSDVEQLQKAAESCSPALEVMAAHGEKIKSVGDGISGIGEKLSVVSGVLAGAATASVAAWKEMDAGYDIVITKTGATGEALESLKNEMDNVFNSLPVTAEEAGTAVGEVNTRFGLMGEELETLSEAFIKFSQINGSDLNSSIDAVDTVMKKFNIDGTETENVLGLLTKVGQDTGLSMEALEGTLSSNGAVLKEMGLDITESANLLAQFEKHGVDASAAMAGLKKAQQNAAKEGKNLEDELNSEIRLIRIAQDDTYAMQKATELFGKKGAAEMAQAIKEGKFSLKELNTELTDYGTIVENTFAETQDPFDESKVAMNNIKSAAADLGTEIMTALAPVIQQLITKVKEVTAWFKGLSSEQKQQVLKIGAIVAAIGPVLTIIGKVISAIGTLMTWLPKIKIAIVAVNTVINANPIGAVILSITALVGAFIHLWNNCEWFRQGWLDFIELIKNAFASFAGWFTGIVANLKDFIDNTWVLIKTMFTTFVTFIVGNFMGQFSSALDKVKSVIEALQIFFQKRVELIKDYFKNIIDFVKNVFTGNWSEAWNNIKNIFRDIWEGFVDVARTPLNVVLSLINGVIDGINNMIGGINSISVDIPAWVPAVGGNSIGFSIPNVPNIPYLAKGGILSSGSAIVGEAGAELLTVMNGRAIVQPLTNNASTVNNATSDNYVFHVEINNPRISSGYDTHKLSQDLAFEAKRELAGIGRLR